MELLERNFILPVTGELDLYYCGRRDRIRGHEYGPAVRSHYLLVFVREGRATLFGRRRDLRLNAGDLLVMFPGEEVHYRSDADAAWSILWLGVGGEFVSELFRDLSVTPEAPVFRPEDPAGIEARLEAILAAADKGAPGGRDACASLLCKFFAVLSLPREDGGGDPVERSKRLFRSRLDEELSVSRIARDLHLDPSYFARIFRRRTGLSPCAYLASERIRRAKYLLRVTDSPVREIARSVGLHDQLYFSRLFRRKIGLSPSEYRLTVRCAGGET